MNRSKYDRTFDHSGTLELNSPLRFDRWLLSVNSLSRKQTLFCESWEQFLGVFQWVSQGD